MAQLVPLDVGMEPEAGAVFSPDGKYRYRLWRVWDRSKPLVLFILLNPSTADEFRLDPTLTRCRNFAQHWGYGGLLVGNIFALRSTDPRALYTDHDPVGPHNDIHLREMVVQAKTTVVGWGTHGRWMDRGNAVVRFIPEPKCLGLNQDGTPKHPLYISSRSDPIPYRLSM